MLVIGNAIEENAHFVNDTLLQSADKVVPAFLRLDIPRLFKLT